MRRDALIILAVVTAVCIFFTVTARDGFQRRMDYYAKERAACMRILNAARTAQDTLFALSAHPSDTRGPSCAQWLP